MTVLDLISIIPDYQHVTVIEKSTDIPIAWYNGKDSIPTELNDREVIEEDSDADGINLMV